MKKFDEIIDNQISISFHIPSNPRSIGVILMPGYLDSKDYFHLTSLGSTLSDNNITAIRFDPTGTWSSQITSIPYSITQYQKDIIRIISYSKSQFNFNKIILIGHSLGALNSLLYSYSHSDVNMVVAIMPPISFARPSIMAKRIEPWKKDGYKISKRDLPNKSDQRKEFNIPYAFVKDALLYSAVPRTPQQSISYFLIAGEKDDAISPQDVKIIYDSITSPCKEFFISPDTIHDYRKHKNQVKIINTHILQFITRYT